MDTSNQISESLLISEAETLVERAASLKQSSGSKLAKLSKKWLIVGEMLADFLASTGALAFSYFLYHQLHLGKQIHYTSHFLGQVIFLYSAFNVWMMSRSGAYRLDSSLLQIRETERILQASFVTFLASLCLSLFANHLVSRWLILLAFFLVPLSLTIEKQVMVSLVSKLHANGYAQQRVVIFGAGEAGRRIFSVLLRSPKLGLQPVAVFDDSCSGTTIFEASYNRRRSVTVSKGMPNARMLREHKAQMVVVADPLISPEKFSEIAESALTAGAAISFVPNNLVGSDHWVDYLHLDGTLLASFEQIRAGKEYELLKRTLDILVSSFLLVTLSPLILLISLAIRLTSSGPVFFAQQRVGRNGKNFKMYKFRSMHADADPYAICPTEKTDPRVTKIGQLLRRTSFDELPQLLNVLVGNMSLVGPRPEMPFIVEKYNALQRQRLTVKPGVTGLWQLSGDRRLLIHENLEYDLYYIRHRTFFMDVAILFHTMIFAMRGI